MKLESLVLSCRSLVVMTCLLIPCHFFGQVARPENEPAPKLPPVWDNRAQERLKALRVAEIDALRSLAERIYGFEIASGARVFDFMYDSYEVRNKMQALVKGAVQTEEPHYTEDGIVEVVYGVNLRSAYEIIARDANYKDKQLSVTASRDMDVEDTLVEALGNGALPGSKGLGMIRAKRAAEIDAYRRMADRVFGLKINSSTTVADLSLKSDSMTVSLIAFLKGLKPTAIVYRDDGTCEVTMQLKIREVVETVERLVKRYSAGSEATVESIENVNRDVIDKIFTVTGYGVIRGSDTSPVSSPASVENTVSGDDLYKAEMEIIKRIISKDLVIE